MSIFNEMSELLQKGKAKELTALIETELSNGTEPRDILNKALIVGMCIIGEKFKNNDIYIPEVLIAARAMNFSLVILKPKLQEKGVASIGKAAICTVKGDLHDIGKNLVKIMLEGNGIEVVDLGVDVDADKIIEVIKNQGIKLICLSSLLTTTMTYQGVIIDAIKKAKLRDKVKIMVGGAPLTQEFADSIGADCYAPNASEAATMAKKLLEL